MTDIDNVLKKLEPVKEVPKTKRGGLRHTWKPILDYAIGKGYLRISEDDVSIQSALNGLKKEANRQNVKITLNTRKINGKLWLYIVIKK
jgi:hypothetical protein